MAFPWDSCLVDFLIYICPCIHVLWTKGVTILPQIYLNSFESSLVLSKILNSLREKSAKNAIFRILWLTFGLALSNTELKFKGCISTYSNLNFFTSTSVKNSIKRSDIKTPKTNHFYRFKFKIPTTGLNINKPSLWFA